MFEKSLIAKMVSDSALVAIVSTYKSAPAIFTDVAPQKAGTVYIVLDLSQYSTLNLAAKGFDVDIYLYSRGGSGKVLRDLAERVEFILDRWVIEDDERFDSLRLFWEDGRPIETKDTNKRRYLCRLTARGGRLKWTQEAI